MKILEKGDKKIRFVVEDITPALAGELRRVMISEIPTMAIEWVDFHKNDSVLWDEIIASRLGLIPLVFDAKFYNLKGNCKCGGKGCVHCQVSFKLKKKGPCMVYSGDMVPSDEKVRPVYDNIPIVELTEGQELELEAFAELNLGKEHAKWQAAVVGYRNVPNIIIGKGGNKSDYEKRCPKHVFVFQNKKLEVDKPLECNMCLQCVELSNGAIKVEADETKFLFNVESTCGLKPEEIVLKSMDILEEKLEELSKDLSKLK
ncbi:MAG: DNA-directed RNA polymerase subunit D [Candidatus Aenigmarchaeota archaeon]|nr:DNA-directed RNA polymerase subunit D [Candidatus Aenigmarchaeota archaeon]